MDKQARRFVRLDATATGNPSVRVGTKVAVTGLSRRFDNTYYVVEAVHRIAPGDMTITRDETAEIGGIHGDRCWWPTELGMKVTDAPARAVIPDENALDQMEDSPQHKFEVGPTGARDGQGQPRRPYRMTHEPPGQGGQNLASREAFDVRRSVALAAVLVREQVRLDNRIDRDWRDLEAVALYTEDLLHEERLRRIGIVRHHIGNPSFALSCHSRQLLLFHCSCFSKLHTNAGVKHVTVLMKYLWEGFLYRPSRPMQLHRMA